MQKEYIWKPSIDTCSEYGISVILHLIQIDNNSNNNNNNNNNNNDKNNNSFVTFLVLFLYTREECQGMRVQFISLLTAEVALNL